MIFFKFSAQLSFHIRKLSNKPLLCPHSGHILFLSQVVWCVLFGILWVIQGKYYNDNNPFYCRFGHVLMPFLGLDSSVCIVSLFDDKLSLYFIHQAEIISWVHVQMFESMHLLKSPYKRRCHFVLTCFQLAKFQLKRIGTSS